MLVPGKQLFSAKSIKKEISRIAEEISTDYEDGFFGLVILKGAFVFASDLIRELTCPVETGFMYASSYVGTQRVSALADYGIIDPERIRGKRILIIEDIVDSGHTFMDVSDIVEKYEPEEIRLCSLLVKPEKLEQNITIDYKGFDIKDHFVVGYGLDFNEKFRELPDIRVLEELK